MSNLQGSCKNNTVILDSPVVNLFLRLPCLSININIFSPRTLWELVADIMTLFTLQYSRIHALRTRTFSFVTTVQWLSSGNLTLMQYWDLIESYLCFANCLRETTERNLHDSCSGVGTYIAFNCHFVWVPLIYVPWHWHVEKYSHVVRMPLMHGFSCLCSHD